MGSRQRGDDAGRQPELQLAAIGAQIRARDPARQCREPIGRKRGHGDGGAQACRAGGGGQRRVRRRGPDQRQPRSVGVDLDRQGRTRRRRQRGVPPEESEDDQAGDERRGGTHDPTLP